jgi:DNA-directed RNA polymerase specialized sigma24 family protein
VTTAGATPSADVAAVQAGDEAAFAVLVEWHRRELHVHCYRMLGSFDEADDLVQEVFLRSWFLGQFLWSGMDYIGEPTPFDVFR